MVQEIIKNYRKSLLFLSLPLFLHCAPFQIQVRHPAPYSAIVEEIPSADPTLLEDRIIVIDPGHGYGLSGAIGENGIREADVNMWVSLYLAEMLREYGAKVILTRAGEEVEVSDEGEALRENLKSRVDLANLLEADLFLSVHHNSSLYQGERYNAIETYYKMGEEGPSLEVARAIHEHLSRNLGIDDNFLLPGNYYLLRNSERPVVLGEASYISNSSMARILRKTEKLHLEAQAYLLGILDYFSRGRPLIRPLFPREDTVYYSRPFLEATLIPGDGNSPIDASSISLTHNGERVSPDQFHFDGEIFRYLPSTPLGSGHNNFELRVRNLKGNSAIPLRFSLVVILPAATIDLRVKPEVILSGGRSLAMIEAFVRDETGSPVVDGKNVEFRIGGPDGGIWIEQTSAGRASLLYEAKGSGRVSIKADCDGIGDEKVLSAVRGSISQAIIILKDRKTDEPIRNATVTLDGGDKSYTSSTSPEGYAIFSTSLEGSYTLTTRKQGYQAYSEMVEMRRGEVARIDLGLNPVQDGVLTGKVVVVDADHVRSADPMVQGYRLSDLNLMVANRLRDLLEASGSEVVMVREGDVPLSPVHRVVKSDSGGADVHFVLRHSPSTKGQGVQISHYPGSLSGERLAGLLREEIGHFISGKVGLKEEASTVLRHTSSPTVAVNARIGMEDGEGGISVERFILLETNAIYNSLLRFFGVPEEDRFELRGVVLDDAGQPVSDALVVVDGALTLRTDEDGKFYLRLLDAGFHHLHTVAEGFLADDHDLFTGIEGSDGVQIVLERGAG